MRVRGAFNGRTRSPSTRPRYSPMKSVALSCAAALVFLVACSGAKQTPPRIGGTSTPGSSIPESCQNLSKLVCDSAAAESSACRAIRVAVEFLPQNSCVEAMKEPKAILARLDAEKASCVQLVQALCGTFGDKSASCALVQEQVPQFDSKRCRFMLEHKDEVINDLKQMEKESAPLNTDEQAAIAAGDAPSFGPPDAKVTVVLFSDFECPYCAKAAEAVAHLRAHYSDKVRFVYRQFPLSFHKHARDAAEAALLAQTAGKFWEFHDEVFKNQDHLEPEALEAYAKFVGMDVTSFRVNLSRHSNDARIEADLALGERVSVKGTPTMFINGKRAANATSAEAVAAEVQAALSE